MVVVCIRLQGVHRFAPVVDLMFRLTLHCRGSVATATPAVRAAADHQQGSLFIMSISRDR